MVFVVFPFFVRSQADKTHASNHRYSPPLDDVSAVEVLTQLYLKCCEINWFCLRCCGINCLLSSV